MKRLPSSVTFHEKEIGGIKIVERSNNFTGVPRLNVGVVVTGATYSSAVLCPAAVDPDEMYLLNLRPTISDLVAGDGFTVTVYSEPQASGNYTVNCIGV